MQTLRRLLEDYGPLFLAMWCFERAILHSPTYWVGLYWIIVCGLSFGFRDSLLKRRTRDELLDELDSQDQNAVDPNKTT